MWLVTTRRRWWVGAGFLLVLALVPGSWQRQSQTEAGNVRAGNVYDLASPAGAVAVTCAWPVALARPAKPGHAPVSLPTHRGCRQGPGADAEWITEC